MTQKMQKPALAIVEAPAEDSEPAPLSPAREAVQRAIAWRADATAAVEEAGRAHQAAERLAGAPNEARARIAALTSQNAAIVVAWAVGGAVGDPEMTGSPGEIETLEREMAEVDRRAAAAKSALPGLSQRIANAQAGATAALAAVREAVVQVVFEEAEVLVEQIRDLEKKTALVRASYQGAINTLDRLGRAHRFGGNEAQRLRLATPARIEFADAALAGAMGRWAGFADALVADERAQLSEVPK